MSRAYWPTPGVSLLSWRSMSTSKPVGLGGLSSMGDSKRVWILEKGDNTMKGFVGIVF